VPTMNRALRCAAFFAPAATVQQVLINRRSFDRHFGV